MNKTNHHDFRLINKKEKIALTQNELKAKKIQAKKVTEESQFLAEEITQLEAEHFGLLEDLKSVAVFIDEKIKNNNNYCLNLQRLFERNQDLIKTFDSLQAQDRELECDLNLIDNCFKENQLIHKEYKSKIEHVNSSVNLTRDKYFLQNEKYNTLKNENKKKLQEIINANTEKEKIENLEKILLISIKDTEDKNIEICKNLESLEKDVSNKIKVLQLLALSLKSQEEKLERLETSSNTLSFNRLYLDELIAQTNNIIKLNNSFFSSLIRK